MTGSGPRTGEYTAYVLRPSSGTEALRIGLAVPAAGVGRRMGGRRKPWLELDGVPVLERALAPFLARSDVVHVRIALSPDDAGDPPAWLCGLDERIGVVPGGMTRAHSVREAVRALPDVDVVAVHDAARPLVTGAVIERCLTALLTPETTPETNSRPAGVVAAWPATDTLKEVDDRRRIVATPERSRLWHAQTPQLFRARPFREALERLEELAGGASITDDASLAEAAGLVVAVVEGDPRNLKVTRPEDLPVAELLLRERAGEPVSGRWPEGGEVGGGER